MFGNVANVGSVPSCRDTSLVKQVVGVLNYSHTFGEEYGLLFLRAKTVDTVADMMSFDFLHGMTFLKDRRYVDIRNVKLRA